MREGPVVGEAAAGEGLRVVLIGDYPPAARAATALTQALLRGLIGAGHRVTTAAMAGQGRAELTLPRRPMFVPPALRAAAPDVIVWVVSRDPADRAAATGWERAKAAYFTAALGRAAPRLVRVAVGGARPGGWWGRWSGARWLTREAAVEAPGPTAARLLADLALGAPGAVEAAAIPASDVALIEQVARQHDFRRFNQIRRIVTPGSPRAPLRAPAQGRRARIANMPEPGTAAAALPVSRYMAYARAALPTAPPADLTEPWEAFEFARWYVTQAPAALRGHTAPVSPALAAWLNQAAWEPWAGRGRVTRLMAAEAAGRNDLTAPGHERLAARWWILDQAGPRQYDPALTPDHVIARLTRPEPGDGAEPFAIGNLLAEIHRLSDTYRVAYDIATPAGRIGFVFDLILHLFDTATRRQIFGQGPVEWLRQPLDGAPGRLGRFEYLVALYCDRPPGSAADVADPTRSDATRLWFREVVCAIYPDFAVFSTLAEADWLARDAAFELIGLTGSDTGLGANLWMSERALAEAGIAPQVRNSEQGFALAPGRHMATEPRAPLRRKAALIHLNADVVPQVVCHPRYDRHADLCAIGFLLWELEALPLSHRLALDLLDEIWVPTQFLVDVYRPATRAPVVWMGKGIELPAVTPMPRARLGVPRDAFVFLVSFDFHSSVERKNPLAAVEAFGLAFDGTGDLARDDTVRLVVKTTEVVPGHWGDPNGQWARIARAAARDSRIVIVTDKMPMDDFLGLIAAADALVTPHRAEGFGYLPAYGLILGRPVIATDYSGSTDFITPQTGFPVAWRPREVGAGETIFPLPGAFWADVEVEALAAAMRAVRADPDAAGARAAAGRSLMATRYSVAAQAQRYRDRLMQIGVIG